jgi:hypothetical protein
MDQRHVRPGRHARRRRRPPYGGRRRGLALAALVLLAGLLSAIPQQAYGSTDSSPDAHACEHAQRSR